MADIIDVSGINGPGRTSTACPAGIDCPGGPDSPIVNVSSEAPDQLIFSGAGYTPFNPYRPPRLGRRGMFYAQNCDRNQISAVSQEDADFITYTLAQICQDKNPDPNPDPNNPNPDDSQMYQNADQTACGFCADGIEFCYTVPALTFASVNGIAEANAQAMAYAQQQVSIIASRGICNNIRCAISSKSPLPDAIQYAPYSYQFSGVSILPAKTWKVISGLMPPGLSMNILGLVSGTPTSSGTYNFRVELTCGGVYKTRANYALKVNVGHFSAYWTFDEANILADKIDLYHGLPLYVDSGFANVPVLDPSGRFGSAVRFNTPAIDGRSAGYLTTAQPPSYPEIPQLKYTAGSGFTFWCWVKMNTVTVPTIGGSVPIVVCVLNLLNASNVNVLNLQVGLTNCIYPYVNSTTLAPITNTIGLWQLMVVKYNPSGTPSLSFKANNGSWTVISSGGSPVPDATQGDFTCFAGVGDSGLDPFSLSVDEMGLVFTVLTDAQLAAIWNGGAGVTWPAIQTIVPP
jgi:hypothetical protein